MTRALFVTHTAAPSGAELATLRLMRALPGAGVEPVAVYAAAGPLVATTRASGIATDVLAEELGRDVRIGSRDPLRFARGLAALARLGRDLGDVAVRRRADVVVATTTKALLMGAVAARRARLPLVWQAHDRATAEFFGPVVAPAVRAVGRVVPDAYIANSRSTLETLRTGNRPVLVAHPGVEPGPAPRRDPQRAAADAVVVLVGRLTPWKGQDVLLRALAAAAHRPRRILLVGGTFFGEEGYRAGLERLAAELGLPVELTGHVDDPGELMRGADVLVHCSTTAEPFGQVVVEGMQAGCAVVASRPGGPSEIVTDGVDGLLVDGGDVAALTAALDRLLADPAERERLAAAGQRTAGRFGVDRTAADVARFLAGVVGERREVLR
ncbi:glycosyltransferase family 4 protein [Pseudonocardia spirodelae]|uniref:Glycosyltransferase family 4 protein n=1 Tax=Pseudonocardia spirodelae TaxID=3133431 RepID=A0ABU8T3E5_9PSEU